jgi:uridylate kinase
MLNMHIVLSIGGSSIIPDGKPDMGFLKAISGLIKKSKHSFGILCGGGTIARLYANAARECGAGEYEADSIAIRSTKQNAHLLITALKGAGVDVFERVIDDFEFAKEPARESRAVVMGGTIPGITTDTDSVLLAEAIGAKRLVNISNVDAIYDSDPRKNSNAKKYSKMGYEELISLASSSDKRMAGTNFVFDMLACKLIARSKIETHFVSFKNMNDLENAVEGKRHGGTVVG